MRLEFEWLTDLRRRFGRSVRGSGEWVELDRNEARPERQADTRTAVSEIDGCCEPED